MSRWVPLLLLVFAFWTQAEDRADKLAATGVAEFNAAYQAWDGARFAAAADLFRQASASTPNSSIYFYWLGTTYFHRMLHLQSQPASRSNQVAADAAMEASLEALTKAVKLNEKDAETHALLGTLYGMKINGNMWRCMTLGPRVQAHCKKALNLAPNNPRVRYLLASCQFHTATKPAVYREALASFLAAEKLFSAEAQRPAQPLDPRWGRSTCLTFIGRSYEVLGQRTEAADYFRKALALHPADTYAKEGLSRVTQTK